MATAINIIPTPQVERNHKVEQAVTELSQAHLDAAAHRLQSLNESVNDDAQVGALANVNIYAAFEPDEIEKRAVDESLRQYSQLWSSFEWVRNVLVLVPITLTWFSFWLAAQDYGALIKSHPELAGNSFLYLWETGFAGHAAVPFLTFSQTAVIAAFFLLVIIFLTILVHYRKDYATTQATNIAAKIRTALDDALWEIEKALSAKRRSDTNAGATEDLQRSIAQFNLITDRMGTSVSQMDTGSREWMNLTRNLDLRLGMIVGEMKDEADGLRVFSNGLTGNVDKMFIQMESATQTNSHLLSAIEQLSGSIQAITVLQEDKLNDIASQLNVLEEQARGWGQALMKSTTDMRVAADRNSSSEASVAGAVATATALLKGQDDLRATILETNKAMEEHRKWVAETVKGAQMAFERTLTNSAMQNNQGAQLAALGNDLKQAMDRMTRSNAEMAQQQVNALNQIRTELSNSMRAFMNERDNMMQTLRRQSFGAPTAGSAPFAPLALAVGAGVLAAGAILVVVFLVLSRLVA